MFSNKEVYALIGSSFLLAFIFGFDDGRESFVFSFWFLNFFLFLVLSLIVLLLRESVRKWCAQYYDIKTEYGLWKIGRWWFHKDGKIKFKGKLREVPLGAILALIITIGTSGKVFFTAIGSTKLFIERAERMGRKHLHIENWEQAVISLSALLVNLALLILSRLLGEILPFDFSSFIVVNFWIMVFNLVPLPETDGGQIFFGSPYLYLFSLVFLLLAYFLLSAGIILSLVLSILSGLLAISIYFIFRERE